MAMTKAEKARIAELERQLRLVRALRFTDPVEPDVPIPEHYPEIAKGFLFNQYSVRVEPACTSTANHAFGRDDETTTQGACPLFSTRLLALRAMRNAVELDCARSLAAIDGQIEKAISESEVKNGE